jgi:hypothetical protein
MQKALPLAASISLSAILSTFTKFFVELYSAWRLRSAFSFEEGPGAGEEGRGGERGGGWRGWW